MATIVPRRRTEIAPMKRGPFFFVWAWELSKVCEREGEWEEGDKDRAKNSDGGKTATTAPVDTSFSFDKHLNRRCGNKNNYKQFKLPP